MESLLREAMDEAQIPRGRELTPAGVAPEERTPLIVVVGLGYAAVCRPRWRCARPVPQRAWARRLRAPPGRRSRVRRCDLIAG